MSPLVKILIEKVVLPIALKVVREAMTPENYGKYMDKLFDFCEDFIADSETKIDDAIFLPIIKSARVLMGVPDLPDLDD